MLRLACVLCLLGVAVGETMLLNESVDQLLSGLNAELAKNGKDTLPVDDMDKEWKYRWHGIRLRGTCKCREGYIRSMASLRRTGDTVFSTDGGRVTLRLALGLGHLELGFNSCQFKAKRLFSITRKVRATVSGNSILAKITLIKNGTQCQTTVDQISLEHLGRLNIHTGGGVLHKIEGNLLDWFADRFHNKIVNRINEELRKLADKNIKKIDLCNKLPA